MIYITPDCNYSNKNKMIVLYCIIYLFSYVFMKEIREAAWIITYLPINVD